MANLGLQNNNPGNLRDPATGSFRTFGTVDEGNQALMDDLKIKQSGQSHVIKPGASLEQFANVWAPASDNNDPKNYAHTLATNLGVDINHPFDQVPPDRLAAAIKVAEGTSTPETTTSHQLSHDQLTANIDAMESQGASQKDIQGYLDSLKEPVLPTAPAPTELDSNSQPIISKGSGIDLLGTSAGVGPLDLTKPIVNTAVNVGKNIWDDIKKSVQEGSDALTRSANGQENPLSAGVDIAKSTSEGIVSPITETVGKVVGKVLNPVLSPVVKAIGDTTTMHAFTDFMSKYPKVADTLSNLIQTGLNLGQVVAGPETAETAAKTKVGDFLPQKSFENSVNDALPVLKNDVRNLPKKYTNMRTALTDIVDNKDSLGLVDSQGKPRLPENFVETTQAQQVRMKQIYKDYSAKLEGVDKEKFDTDIHDKIFNQIDDIKNQIDKENSVAGRKALVNNLHELSSLRDTSPEGIQNYIESLNQEAKTGPGQAPSISQIKAANLAGSMRKVLDDSVDKIDGQGYQDLRNTYGAHRAVQDQFLMAAKKELNNTPGLVDKLTTLGFTGEGINFLLTHDPKALLIAGGVKGANKLLKWFSSPQRALKNLYGGIEDGTYRNDLNPSKIIQSANIDPKNTNIK